MTVFDSRPIMNVDQANYECQSKCTELYSQLLTVFNFPDLLNTYDARILMDTNLNQRVMTSST